MRNVRAVHTRLFERLHLFERDLAVRDHRSVCAAGLPCPQLKAIRHAKTVAIHTDFSVPCTYRDK